MKQKSSLIRVFLLIFVLASFLIGCGDKKPSSHNSTPDTTRMTNKTFLQQVADGVKLYENESASQMPHTPPMDILW